MKGTWRSRNARTGGGHATDWGTVDYWQLAPAILLMQQHMYTSVDKKALRETQTLRAAVAVVRRRRKFRPTADPLPGGAGYGQNLISWRRSLPLPINPVWWRSMHAISSYRGNRSTNTPTNTQTHRQDRLQYTAPLSLAAV